MISIGKDFFGKGTANTCISRGRCTRKKDIELIFYASWMYIITLKLRLIYFYFERFINKIFELIKSGTIVINQFLPLT